MAVTTFVLQSQKVSRGSGCCTLTPFTQTCVMVFFGAGSIAQLQQHVDQGLQVFCIVQQSIQQSVVMLQSGQRGSTGVG